jgi:hypothetical protein
LNMVLNSSLHFLMHVFKQNDLAHLWHLFPETVSLSYS